MLATNFYDFARSVDCGSHHVWHIWWIHSDFAEPRCLDSVDEIHPEPKDRFLVAEDLI